MKSSKPSLSLTTVSVDTSVRDRINSEAVRLGLSQRQMVTRMAEAYDLSLQREESSPAQIEDIYEALGKVLKRDERIIAFIKEQEKVLLNPILTSVNTTESRINQLIQLLSNLE